jgi:hypothetical protein
MSFNASNFQVLTTLGYVININYDGTFPISQIRWTAAGCSGTPYLNGTGTRYSKNVVYSGSAAGLYMAAGANSNGVSTATTATMATIENPTCMSGSGTQNGFLLTPVTQTGIGLPATITPPFTF